MNACLKLYSYTPVDQLPKIDAQLVQSQHVVAKYSVLGNGNQPLDDKDLDQFMSDFWFGTQWDNGILAFGLSVAKNIRYERQQYSRLYSISVATKPYGPRRNLANNNLSGNLPYSISSMVSLNYLNVSRNSLSQSIGDIFANLGGLTTLDLFFSNLTGNLPISFNALSNLSTIHVQNNQLTGPLDVLAGLPLTDLNVANNHFSGWIPKVLISIHHFIYDGNSFDNSPAPPLPLYTSPPTGRPHSNHSHSPPGAHASSGSNGQPSNPNDGNKKGLTTGSILGITLGFLFVVLFAMLVLVFCHQKGKRKEPAVRTSAGSLPVSTDKDKFGAVMTVVKSNIGGNISIAFVWAIVDVYEEHLFCI